MGIPKPIVASYAKTVLVMIAVVEDVVANSGFIGHRGYQLHVK